MDIAPGKCEDAFAYIPDLGSYAVVVYSLRANSSFRVQHHYFYMDPLQGNFTVGGVNFQWTDGIFSLALGPHHADGFRTIYFHALASTLEFTVNSATLQNSTAAENYYGYEVGYLNLFIVYFLVSVNKIVVDIRIFQHLQCSARGRNSFHRPFVVF